MEVARFNPTRQQALGRGLYYGVLASVLGSTLTILAWAASGAPPAWWWALLTVAPPAAGGLAGLLLTSRLGTVIDAGGIRTVTPFARGVQPWSRVVDLRAERRGGRTVVSVYLDSGASLQLRAPYSGELFAADPRFESKVFALSNLWRSHRFGGLST
jgi:hypothetical protein